MAYNNKEFHWTIKGGTTVRAVRKKKEFLSTKGCQIQKECCTKNLSENSPKRVRGTEGSSQGKDRRCALKSAEGGIFSASEILSSPGERRSKKRDVEEEKEITLSRLVLTTVMGKNEKGGRRGHIPKPGKKGDNPPRGKN